MNEPDKVPSPSTMAPAHQDEEISRADPALPSAQRTTDPEPSRRWWVSMVVPPALFLACGTALFAGLGLAQRMGIVASSGRGGHAHASVPGESLLYICPMMCTPPQSTEGRCPVCGMELVLSTTGGGESDTRSIQIDPAARRVANIHTLAVKAISMSRDIRAVGELSYDEGKLKTISAYVDGRIERLYTDYTGVVVEKGDHLALLYSPRL
jgi:Cu(I)/Ag(I) efflux system membrane fusion protein